ncbi:MAG TPA: hypothetical protein VGM54_15175 [Chthoniobacter sp.]|jgi:AraC-like DNA-binding protein
MSVSPEKLAAWRRAGSLRYLAHELGISPKQVARYWDQGWIPGAEPRRKGGRHRRVRYTEDTVARVAERVAAVKETNLAIRYRLEAITHQGRRISVAGCTSRESLRARLRAAGLSREEAARLASKRRYRQQGGVLWQARLPAAGLLGLRGLTPAAVAEDERLLTLLPLEHLLAAPTAKEFRLRAREAYRELCATGIARAACLERLIRPILFQPNLKAFARAYNRAAESFPHWEYLAQSPRHQAAAVRLLQAPHEAILLTVLAEIREAQERPSVAAIARRLGASRKKVYRIYGKEKLRAMLGTVRYDRVS